MSIAYNEERGEKPLSIGGTEIVVAAEMGRLAALSSRLGASSFVEMYSKLAGAEINAVMAAVELLAVRGDAAKAIKGMTLADLPKCVDAIMAVFAHHAEKVPGNDQAAREKAEASDSLGGNT
ncbi:hypothetical protein [Bradyrhizobium sp. STM 3561]|uniref:hypothetical protein n=1 Tax=Bradyrhizobium sp. STM 3561 TaxID=578923 RepID=UPI00388F240C